MKRLVHLIALFSVLSAFASTDAKASRPQQDRAPPVVRVPAATLLPTGRVTDAAHVLSPKQRGRLSAKLEGLERSTRHQVAVVTVQTLGGRDVAEYTRDLSNRWGVGRKGYSDGVMLLVAPNQRKVRIAVGYGLERHLTHTVCQRIIDTKILPHFRRGDLPGGIEAGADAIIALLR